VALVEDLNAQLQRSPPLPVFYLYRSTVYHHFLVVSFLIRRFLIPFIPIHHLITPFLYKSLFFYPYLSNSLFFASIFLVNLLAAIRSK